MSLYKGPNSTTIGYFVWLVVTVYPPPTPSFPESSWVSSLWLERQAGPWQLEGKFDTRNNGTTCTLQTLNITHNAHWTHLSHCILNTLITLHTEHTYYTAYWTRLSRCILNTLITLHTEHTNHTAYCSMLTVHLTHWTHWTLYTLHSKTLQKVNTAHCSHWSHC